MITLDAYAVEAFRKLVASRLGLSFDESKGDFLADVLRLRISECGLGSPEAYLRALEGGRDAREMRRLAESLTVTETYFFRNADHFRALIETVVPERIALQAGKPRLRILSAGCASGEEAYSLSMAIRHHFPAAGAWDIRIRGVDLNPAMLAKAKAGIYSSWALRESPAWAIDRHFTRSGGGYRLSDAVLASVEFEERNLIEANDDLWVKQALDVVFFRNVLMYFSPETASRVIARIEESLAPGGFLFLGHAETLRGLSNAFHLCHKQNTFYYRKPGKEAAGSTATWSAAAGVPGLPGPAEAAGMGAPPEPASAWVEVIQKASERIAGLQTRPQPQAPSQDQKARNPPERSQPAGIAGTPPGWSLGDALDLLRRERFAEAMDALGKLPPDSGRDPDALLLRAALLTNMGDRSEAESVCRRLLASDEFNAGAHYLMAICREHAGDLAAAEEHDQTAIYLDGAFAMPWLHRGLLAGRRGGREDSARYLEHALALLAKEDSARILLFGGGFGREALMQLCRAGIRVRGEGT